MRQLTLRIEEDLAQRLKTVAAQSGRSVNAYAGAVLRAAVDPELAGSEAERLRERLSRAGLLDDSQATTTARITPDPADVEAARKRSGRGRALSDVVNEGRS